jgi:DNA (cytosine-5)-methyltransferase 1
MKHGSLFSGIGGFDLAAEWMGWENVFHCEWNEFGQKVLHHYWPNAETFTDITKSDFTKYANKIDILTGGFPCQPYSMAGKRKGKEDERHLWPEMLRAIREIKPKYIVGENVFGLLNWNGGLVFDEVHTDLEFEGYEVQAVVIPAAAVNAPHGRDRVWFVAYNYNNGLHGTKDGQSVGQRDERNKEGQNQTCESTRCAKEDASFTANTKNCGCGRGVCERCSNGKRKLFSDEQRRCEMGGEIKGHSGIGNVTDTANIGRKDALENGELEGGRFGIGNKPPTWDAFPSQSPICGGDDGIPTKLDGITFSKWRNESIKAYGNAIVPQVAYEIFKAIQRTI